MLDVDVPLSRRHVWALVAGGVVLILAILSHPLGARETPEGGLPADVSFPGYLVIALLGIAIVRRLARRLPGWRPVVFVAAIAFVFWTIEGVAYRDWINDGATHVRNDEDMTKLGLIVRATSPPDTSVAVIWAGSMPYYARRPTVDMLGKNDPVVAHLASRTPFDPGHSKWDYSYSIGSLRPDVVVGLTRHTREDRRHLLEWGYDELDPDLYASADAAVDRHALLQRASDETIVLPMLGPGASPIHPPPPA